MLRRYKHEINGYRKKWIKDELRGVHKKLVSKKECKELCCDSILVASEKNKQLDR